MRRRARRVRSSRAHRRERRRARPRAPSSAGERDAADADQRRAAAAQSAERVVDLLERAGDLDGAAVAERAPVRTRTLVAVDGGVAQRSRPVAPAADLRGTSSSTGSAGRPAGASGAAPPVGGDDRSNRGRRAPPERRRRDAPVVDGPAEARPGGASAAGAGGDVVRPRSRSAVIDLVRAAGRRTAKYASAEASSTTTASRGAAERQPGADRRDPRQLITPRGVRTRNERTVWMSLGSPCSSSFCRRWATVTLMTLESPRGSRSPRPPRRSVSPRSARAGDAAESRPRSSNSLWLRRAAIVPPGRLEFAPRRGSSTTSENSRAGCLPPTAGGPGPSKEGAQAGEELSRGRRVWQESSAPASSPPARGRRLRLARSASGWGCRHGPRAAGGVTSNPSRPGKHAVEHDEVGRAQAEQAQGGLRRPRRSTRRSPSASARAEGPRGCAGHRPRPGRAVSRSPSSRGVQGSDRRASLLRRASGRRGGREPIGPAAPKAFLKGA